MPHFANLFLRLLAIAYYAGLFLVFLVALAVLVSVGDMISMMLTGELSWRVPIGANS